MQIKHKKFGQGRVLQIEEQENATAVIVDFGEIGKRKFLINDATSDTLRTNAEHLLQRALGDQTAQFRPGQWEAINELVSHTRRVLVVERTGWGKSMVYFLATRILRDKGQGLTLIISPLLALMRNQEASAKKMGLRAVTINSTNPGDWKLIENDIKSNQIDLLLVSPERFANERFLQNVILPAARRIGLLVVDEAHCISDWGHDFRPDYRRIVELLKQLPPNLPVIGTTATANDRVINDIKHQLGNIHVQRGPLTRESLQLQVMILPDQASRLAWLADHVPSLSGTGIVYVLTKRDAESVSSWLRLRGIDAHAYYSGVKCDEMDTNEYREYLEQHLFQNKIKVLVATSALGMGYDKPDITFVIHYQTPGSVITYYQQVGRAGRAVPRAVGILFSGEEDATILEYFRNNAFPSEEIVDQLLAFLRSRNGATVPEIERSLNLRKGGISKVLRYLSVQIPSPIVKKGAKWYRTAVRFTLDKVAIERLTRQREVEWEQMKDYTSTSGCRMAFLQGALNDSNIQECQHCDKCLDQPPVGENYSRHLVFEAQQFLRCSEIPIEARKQIPKEACSQYDKEYGIRGRLAQDMQAQEGRVLSLWADAGWGSLVKEGKIAGHFSDELVDAVAEMIQKRWRPDPYPTWVTNIPSARNPNLVRSFSQRIAKKLGLQFSEVLTATGSSEPQKLQQNSFHQCNNLDGAFTLTGRVITAPLFLVDDIVDSRWTFTIASALLGQAGSKEIYPVALASTANS